MTTAQELDEQARDALADGRYAEAQTAWSTLLESTQLHAELTAEYGKQNIAWNLALTAYLADDIPYCRSLFERYGFTREFVVAVPPEGPAIAAAVWPQDDTEPDSAESGDDLRTDEELGDDLLDE